MGEAPIGRLLISMAWPAMISMLINSLYNIVDSIFVAMIGKEALTAISLINPIQLLMIALGVGSSIGVNSLIARCLGARRRDDADKAASTGVWIGVFNFIVFATMGLAFAKSFMKAYTSDPDVYRYGVEYLKIVTSFSLFFMLHLQLEKILQATGNMLASMVISIAGALTNIILDPVMIFGLFGFPRLEVAGAAFATVAGQAVALTMAIFLVCKNKNDIRIKIRGFRIETEVVKNIYRVGLPAMVMQSIGSVMIFGFNSILSASTTAVAVLGIYFRLQSFVFMPVFGLNQGAMPIMGFNYGARNKTRLMDAYKKSLLIAIAIMAVGTIFFQLAPKLLLAAFSPDEEMLMIGVPALRIISVCFLPAAFGIMCSTLFQATAHGMYSMLASLIRQLFGILPLAYFLYNNYGVTASWAAFPLAEIAGTLFSALAFRHIYKTEISKL